ncbi:hypothetical protein [Streptomyces chartreusis]|uniref:hypothetical protein n=1 Tax=Streptomyces chartreusis TaxID=1969 RepID=UPI003414F9F5
MNSPARVLRTWLAVTGTVLVVVTSGACTAQDGTGDRGASSASAPDPEQQDPPVASDGSSQDGDDAGLRYASCMRDNGVQVDDPAPGRGAEVPMDVPQTQVDRAEKVCGKNPTGGAQSTDLPDTVQTDAEYQALQLKFWSCMRKNGFENPKAQKGGSAVLENTPKMRAAMEACKAEDEAQNKRLEELIEAGKG